MSETTPLDDLVETVYADYETARTRHRDLEREIFQLHGVQEREKTKLMKLLIAQSALRGEDPMTESEADNAISRRYRIGEWPDA